MNVNEIIGNVLTVGLPILISVIALIKPLLTLNTSLTQLNAAVKTLTEKFEAFEINNHDDHKRIWRKNDEQDKVIQEHDKRLTLLEKEDH